MNTINSIAKLFMRRTSFQRSFFVFCLLLISLRPLLMGQNWLLQKEVAFPKAEMIQLDEFGNVFVATSDKNIFKLDSLGKQLETYSPNGFAKISDWQVSRSVNIFLFYEDWQKFTLLDRFLGNARDFSLEEESMGYVTAAALASDGNIWLFDQSDFSLKKFNPTNKEIILSFPFNFIADDLSINQLREYQGKVFGISDTQLYVFNFLGELEWQMDWENPRSIVFENNRLLWIEEAELKSWEIFQDQQQSYRLPEGISAFSYRNGTLWSVSKGKIIKWKVELLTNLGDK